jgi:hypothetical protein
MESSQTDTSSLNSRHGLVRRTILACALILFIVYALDYSVEWRRRRLVQELSTDVQRLRVGLTAETEIQSLSQKYKGTYSKAEKRGDSEESAHYLVAIWSPLLVVGQNYHTLAGRRAWGAQAYLPVENGHLSRAYFELASFRSDGLELSASARLAGSTPLAAPEGVSYYVYEAHVTGPPTESLNVELGPAATPEEYRKSFDFNLSCLTGFRECRHVCELMPTAWKDLPSERRIQYGDGRDKVMDSECRKRLR